MGRRCSGRLRSRRYTPPASWPLRAARLRPDSASLGPSSSIQIFSGWSLAGNTEASHRRKVLKNFWAHVAVEGDTILVREL